MPARKTAPSPRVLTALLATHACDALWFESQSGEVTFAIGNFKGLMGIPTDDFADGVPPWEKIIHPEDQQDALPHLTAVPTALGDETTECRVIHSDDVTMKRLAIRRHWHDGDFSGVIGSARDVTDERALALQLDLTSQGLEQVDASLQASADRMQVLFEHAGEAIFILDPQTLNIIEANRRAKRLIGMPGQGVKGLCLAEFFDRDEADGLRQHITMQAEVGTAVRWRGHLESHSGERRVIEMQAAPVRLENRQVVPCFVRDISSQIQEHINLLRFEQILRGISDSTVNFDMQGRVTFANSAAERLWERKTWEDVEVWDLYAQKVPVVRTATGIDVEGAADHAEGEFLLAPREGVKRPCFTSFNLVRDQSGEPIGVVTITRDVTQEKALQQQVLQGQKMESIGTLAGGVAHDFNNLLGGILGYAELLLGSLDAESRAHQQARLIESSAIRASHLTQQLLSFSRKGKFNIRVTSLSEVTESAITILQGSLPKTILLHTDMEPKPCNIEVDTTQLEQVILNLGINARDAVSQAGWITIRVRNRELDEDFCRDRLDLKPGLYAELMIKDTGHGIDESILPHIFEPFYTTKDLGKGTGLGLSVVYGIVKNHGGHIEVKSTSGVGTQFFVYIPSTRKKPTVERETTPSTVESGSEQILVVDDESTIRELAQDILQDLGYTVITAQDGMEALEIYEREGPNIALIIMDMQMPTLNGLQTFERVKQMDPSVRVLLSSGYGMDQDIQGALDSGMMDFIQKPYKINALAQVVRECIDAERS